MNTSIEMKKKILLYNYFGNYIITRNAVADIFERLNNAKGEEIIMDFNKIEFISRSSADEYIKRKLAFNKRLVEKNISPNALAMFFLVIKQSKLKEPIITITS